jgi:hypothetical protein
VSGSKREKQEVEKKGKKKKGKKKKYTDWWRASGNGAVFEDVRSSAAS